MWFLLPQQLAWTAAKLLPSAAQLCILPSTGDAIIRKSGRWKKQQKVLVSTLI